MIISEKKDKKAEKYLVRDLPFPYTSKAQFERRMEVPLGMEWNTRKGFQRGTMPRVTKKVRRACVCVCVCGLLMGWWSRSEQLSTRWKSSFDRRTSTLVPRSCPFPPSLVVKREECQIHPDLSFFTQAHATVRFFFITHQ